MFIQEIRGWNTGTRLTNTDPDLDLCDSWIVYEPENDRFVDSAGNEHLIETVDLTSPEWEAVPVCCRCGGSGLEPTKAPENVVQKPKKGKK
jgi:hypothetical protein